MFLISSYSCLCSIHWSQVLSREWRCSWSSADRRCSNYIWVIDNFIAYQGATYSSDFTVHVYLIMSWWVIKLHLYVTDGISFNSLAHGRFQRHFSKVIFQLILVIDDWSISCKIVLKWMPMDLTDGKSTLVAWWHQAITWANVDPDLCRHMA